MEQLGPGCKNSDDAPYARDVVNYPGALKWMNFSSAAKNQAKETVLSTGMQKCTKSGNENCTTFQR